MMHVCMYGGKKLVVVHRDRDYGCRKVPKAIRGMAYRNETLEGDQRGLEVWTHADACDDLEDDDFGPGGVRTEVDE